MEVTSCWLGASPKPNPFNNNNKNAYLNLKRSHPQWEHCESHLEPPMILMMMMISIAWGKLELTCAVLALSVDRPMFLLLSDDFRCYSSFDQWHWSRSCVPFVGSHSGLLTSEGAYELFMSLRHNLVQVILWRKVLSLTCPRLLCGTTWDFPRRLIVSVVTRSWGDRAGKVEIFVGNKYTEFKDGDKKEQ